MNKPCSAFDKLGIEESLSFSTEVVEAAARLMSLLKEEAKFDPDSTVQSYYTDEEDAIVVETMTTTFQIVSDNAEEYASILEFADNVSVRRVEDDVFMILVFFPMDM